MAEYTIELRKVLEYGHNIFDFPYPFYDEEKRVEFERNFIRHFYFREIGSETIDRFKVYLQDKFMTALPYYNELFKAAQIEYSILDNYKLVEDYTITREQTGKSSGVSSTVGQVFDEQTTEGTDERNTETSGDRSETGTNTSETSRNETTEGTGSTSENRTENGTSETTSNKTETTDGKVLKRYLDTPQGSIDFTQSRYLTWMQQDENDATVTDNGTENQTTENTVEGRTTSSDESTVSGSQSETGTSNISEETSGNEKTTGKNSSTAKGEQKSTQDNNTRMESIGTQTETFHNVRSGNIGVDTDSDMIEKHIRLQKTLRNIEKMFFDECEDLFMMVW